VVCSFGYLAVGSIDQILGDSQLVSYITVQYSTVQYHMSYITSGTSAFTVVTYTAYAVDVLPRLIFYCAILLAVPISRSRRGFWTQRHAGVLSSVSISILLPNMTFLIHLLRYGLIPSVTREYYYDRSSTFAVYRSQHLHQL
jgi:hypothetical protein